MSEFESEELSEKERLKRRNAEYYARNREKINQRSKERYKAHKEEQRATRRKNEKKYRERHADYVRARKRQWDKENAESCAAYASKRRRECREMTERAKFVCPVFIFLTFVRTESLATYTIAYKPNERVVPKMAKLCNALRIMDGRNCPLVKRVITDRQEMMACCPMNKAFKISGAAARIAEIAAIMRNNRLQK